MNVMHQWLRPDAGFGGITSPDRSNLTPLLRRVMEVEDELVHGRLYLGEVLQEGWLSSLGILFWDVD